MTEIEAANSWVYDVLKADATLLALLATAPADLSYSIYLEVAPEDAVYPFIVISSRATSDVTTGGGTTLVMTPVTTQVRAWDDGTDNTAINSIISRVQTLLQGATSTSYGGYSMTAFRHMINVQPIVDEGNQYRMQVSHFRILVRQSIS